MFAIKDGPCLPQLPGSVPIVDLSKVVSAHI
jgi:hypothetical protein